MFSAITHLLLFPRDMMCGITGILAIVCLSCFFPWTSSPLPHPQQKKKKNPTLNKIVLKFCVEC